jgi:hypothetical protein
MLVTSKRAIIALGLVLAAATASGQDPEVIVGEIEFPKRTWGVQALPFEITNNTDWLKFLVVETDAAFEGSYVNPHRVVRTTFVLEPSDRKTVDSKLEIPPNYGKLTLRIRIYDVVDTLDDLSVGTVVFEQPFMIKFHTPDGVAPYFQERVTLPPLVGNHGILDNEFARIMLLMLHEKKTLPEIAELCQADTAFTREMADQMVQEKYLRMDKENYIVALPIINNSFAQAGRKLADGISDRLAEMITNNLNHRQGVIDSMVKAGGYSGDSTNFTEGGTLLFRTFPLVGGLYLWQVMGQRFISGSRGFQIYARTDPCNARIGQFMYLVQGGDYFNGHHFFMADPSRGGYDTRFGDSLPTVECKPGFDSVATETIYWNFSNADHPDMYIYDSTFINPVLRVLDVGAEAILADATAGLTELNTQYGGPAMMTGTNYWFWNLTASLTLDKLIKNNVVARTGNGKFRFKEKTR